MNAKQTTANSSRYDTGHSIFNFNTVGIKVQYNYSHDNLWFCGIMKRPNANVTIRYNVSQNDKDGIYFYGFEGQKSGSNIRIYNNTHFVKKGLEAQVIAENRTPLASTFENNIFYFEGEGRWGSKARGIKTLFNNNVYFNLAPHSSERNARLLDPRFTSPGKADAEIDLRTMNALEGYRLQPDSPAFKGATQIENHGGQNILKEVIGNQRQRYGAI